MCFARARRVEGAARGRRAHGPAARHRRAMALRGRSHADGIHRDTPRRGTLRASDAGARMKRIVALVLVAAVMASCATRRPAPVVERTAPPAPPPVAQPATPVPPPVEKPPEKPIPT